MRTQSVLLFKELRHCPFRHAWVPLSNHILHCIKHHPQLGMYSCHAAIHLHWHTESAHCSKCFFFLFLFLTFGGRRFSFIVSCGPSGVNSVLVGNVFVFPITAPGWPYRNGSHHNKALWIISLGQPILPGSTLLSSTPPAPAKSQWTVCNSAKLNQLKLMQILLFEGKRLDVSRYGGLHLRQTAEQEKGSQISSVTGTTSGDIYGGLSQICNHPVL